MRFDDGLTTLGASSPGTMRNIFSMKPQNTGSITITSLTTAAAPAKKQKQKQKQKQIYGKSLAAKKFNAEPLPATQSPTHPIKSTALPSIEEKPKSNRWIKEELKKQKWEERLEHLKQTNPKEQNGDEEIEFLRKKRAREREAAGSGISLLPHHSANEKKRRKTEKKLKKKTEFPLLNGEPVPKYFMTAALPPQPSTQGHPINENRAHPAQLKAQAHHLQKQREQLPIWQHQDSLRQCLRDRDVLVMLGQTGSGKSTQIGQFFLNEPWMQRRRVRVGSNNINIGGCIAITQPRRVAAINLAKRVAAEMGVRLGEEVGYSVRFQNQTSEKTRIKFLTDGMLLQEMLADPLLKRYSVVVVDEAHERTIGTDLVMGFLRGLVYGQRKQSLKAVVMSATLEVEAMAKFFEENRGEGLLPLKEEEIEDTKMDDSQDNIKEDRLDAEMPNTNGDIETDKKSRKKKNRKKGRYNPEDLIRTPSPIPERIRTPDPDEELGALVKTDEGVGVIPYFGSVALFQVPGRQYTVEVNHTAEPVSDFLEAALKTVFQIHTGEPFPGDILVFLTGQDEIDTLQKSIQDYAEGMDKALPKISVLPLYAALPIAVQNRVFQPASTKFTRKVILSTNIAETSVTVTGVRYVIDCGKAKLKQFRPKIGLESLLITPISRSSAMQRTGRAGREAPGKCFRLYTEEDFKNLKETTKPEILRTDISNAILILKARGQDDVINFDYLSPPKPDSLRKALEQLYSLSAFDAAGKITSLGRQMAKLPLAPPLARVLLAAADPALNCLPEVVDVIAALSTENLFPPPPNDDTIRVAMEEARKAFHRTEGDHIMLLEMVRAYEASPIAMDGRRHWCESHFVSIRAMHTLFDIRKQLRQYCQALPGAVADWESACGEAVSPDLAQRVLKAFLRGYFHKTARAAPAGVGYLTVLGHQNVMVHPTSILFSARREAIMYHEYVFTTKAFGRWCSAVQLDWVAEAAPGYLKGAV